jgi:hypothetical protein
MVGQAFSLRTGFHPVIRPQAGWPQIIESFVQGTTLAWWRRLLVRAEPMWHYTPPESSQLATIFGGAGFQPADRILSGPPA